MPSCHSTRLAVLFPAAVLAACSADTPAAPVTTAERANVIAAQQTFANVQLRTLPNLVSYAWGNAKIGVNAIPTDPCKVTVGDVPAGFTAVTICATIFNKGGVNFSTGKLVRYDGLNDTVGQDVAGSVWGTVGIPTDPCRRYDVAGYALVKDQFAQEMITGGNYGLVFGGASPGTTLLIDQIGAYIGASAWGAADATTTTDTWFSSNVCQINVSPTF